MRSRVLAAVELIAHVSYFIFLDEGKVATVHLVNHDWKERLWVQGKSVSLRALQVAEKCWMDPKNYCSI